MRTFRRSLNSIASSYGEDVGPILKFGAVGFVAFLVYLLCVAITIHFGGGPVAGAVLGFVGGTIISFVGNCRFVFKAAPSLVAGRRFLVTTLLGFGLNITLAWLLTRWGVHYLMMTVIIFVLVPGFNYLCHRFWTFSPQPSGGS